jgi:hypothetical protein
MVIQEELYILSARKMLGNSEELAQSPPASMANRVFSFLSRHISERPASQPQHRLTEQCGRRLCQVLTLISKELRSARAMTAQ